MEINDLIASLSASSPVSAFAIVALYYLRQIHVSFDHFKKTIDTLQESVSDLNSTLTRLVVERDRDKQDIDRLRNDFHILEGKFSNGKS
jgi:hypothetical protein